MKYLYICIFLLVGIIGKGQCGLLKPYVINDFDNEMADTTNVSLLVDGATNNNLATAQQGLCGVKLKFKHPFMKELYIELISPAGQKITLVGGDIVATNTPFITWDVTFVPCSASPAPDLGFLPQWENNQLWQSFSIYTGQYHPYLGCLEGFNTGSVNGTWTFRCIDFEDGGVGELLDAKLIFCQDEGVSCGGCVLNPGVIENPDLLVCQGDPSLKITLNKIFPGNLYNENVYNYSNVIIKDSTIIAYVMNPDMLLFSPGVYTICGIQVSKLQNQILPKVGSKFTQATLSDYFFALGACAAVSEECMVVEIKKTIEPVDLTVYICKGETFVIADKSFINEGNYEVIIENGACDSIVNLELKVIDIKANIASDRDSISCNGNTVALVGSNAGSLVNELEYNWFTLDGVIQGDPAFYIIDAVKEGTYFLEVTGITPQKTCRDTISKVIFPDKSFPEILFQRDTITCAKDTVEIGVVISRPTSSVIWKSKGGNNFSKTLNGIKVWTPGLYYISVIADNGCSVLDSIEVIENTNIIVPVITKDSITCRKDSASILLTFPPETSFVLQWESVDDRYKNSNQVYVHNGGNYAVTITDTANGCMQQLNINVAENLISPQIRMLSADTINCNNKITNPRIQVDKPIETYVWKGTGFTSMEVSPAIFMAGTYFVTVTASDNGCTASAQIEIFTDTLIADVQLKVDSINCLQDTVQILLTESSPLKSLVWNGPIGFQTNDFSPMVSEEGLYIVTYAGYNGCVGYKAITVFNSINLPDTDYFPDSIKCGIDTIQLKEVSIKPNYSYSWAGPGLLQNNIAQPLVNEPGIYRVTITDNNTGCTAIEYAIISEGRIFTTPDISVLPLDCTKDSVQIVITNTDIKSIVYTGPGFYSEELSPFVSKTGIYNFIFVNDNNCISSGSIEVISDGTLPLIDKIFEPFICGQDSVLLSANSNTPGTIFKWSGPNGFNKSGAAVYGYQGGTYILTGTAQNGCSSELQFEVGYDTIPPLFSILPFGALTCMDSVVTLETDFNPLLGEIMWTTEQIKSSTLDVTEPGIYLVKVVGKNNCSATKEVVVLENKNFATYEAEASVINCRDLLSKIVITPTSAFTKLDWRNTVNPSVIPSGQLTTNTSFPGIYVFDMLNDEGCITEGRVEVITDIIPPVILSKLLDTIDCKNTTVDIGVLLESEATEYLWNGPNLNDLIGGNTLKVSDAGTYYLKITGKNFCVTSAEFEIIKDENIPVYTVFFDTLTCDKGKINIGINPITANLSYLWSGPGQFESTSRNPKVFEPGDYLVTITGSNGCSLTDKITVVQTTVKPSLIIPDTLLLPCSGNSISLMVSSDTQILRYNWVFPDGTLVNLATPSTNIPGDYKVQIAGLNGCASINKSFHVGVDKTKPSFIYQSDTINCLQSMAFLKANSVLPDLNYLWLSPAGLQYQTANVTTVESGEFLLIVTDKNECKDSAFINVVLDTISPVINIIKSGDIQCEVRQVYLDASLSDKGDQLVSTWTTVGGNIINTQDPRIIELDKSGQYTFSLNNLLNGCKNSTTINITETPQKFTILDVEAEAPTCSDVKNGRIRITDLNGTPPFSVYLQGVDRDIQRIFNNLEPGLYSIKVRDSAGCIQQRDIEVPKAIELSIGIETVFEIKFGDSVLLKPIVNIDPSGKTKLRWYKRDSLICDDCAELWVRPFVNTYYTIEYSSDMFCSEKTEVLVKVKNDIEKSIPNVFAPGSNLGTNNFFYIPQTRGIENINSIYIFDRWAENVYSIKNILPGDPLNGWDGTFNGKECQMGVYVVLLELVLSDGSIWKYRGDVLLVR